MERFQPALIHYDEKYNNAAEITRAIDFLLNHLWKTQGWHFAWNQEWADRYIARVVTEVGGHLAAEFYIWRVDEGQYVAMLYPYFAKAHKVPMPLPALDGHYYQMVPEGAHSLKGITYTLARVFQEERKW